jgi:isoquinoline 1-oxidoreductase beta subunit
MGLVQPLREPAPETGLARRAFLRSSSLVGGGLLLGYFTPAEDTASASTSPGPPSTGGESPLTPWVRVTPDNVVTIVVSQAEIGQGISTTLPAILAGA